MAEVPETTSADLPRELLIKYNMLQAMDSAMQNCWANRMHAANLLCMILNNAVDPQTAPPEEMKQRVIRGIVFSTADVLVRHIQSQDNVHSMVHNLDYSIQFLTRHFHLNEMPKLIFTMDFDGYSQRDDAVWIAALEAKRTPDAPSLADRFSGEGLIKQFLESDIWVEHIDAHFADLIKDIRENVRGSIDYEDTSKEGLAKLNNIDFEEKAQIYAARKAITSLYLTSGQDDVLPSIEAVQNEVTRATALQNQGASTSQS
jgi:hypothetical protein